MVTQDNTESGLLRVMAMLRTQEKDHENALVDIRAKMEAVGIALALLRQTYGLPESERSTIDPLVERVRGKTHVQALITIADANNGKVRIRDAKRIFLSAGLKKNPRTASPGITSTLSRSPHFEPSGKGEYTLVSRPNQSTFLRAAS